VVLIDGPYLCLNGRLLRKQISSLPLERRAQNEASVGVMVVPVLGDTNIVAFVPGRPQFRRVASVVQNVPPALMPAPPTLSGGLLW